MSPETVPAVHLPTGPEAPRRHGALGPALLAAVRRPWALGKQPSTRVSQSGPSEPGDPIRAPLAQDFLLRDIQAQHRRIFALVHEYQQLVAPAKDHPAALGLLVLIVEQVEANFSTEEQLLEELASPDLDAQRLRHRRVIDELRRAVDAWRSSGGPGSERPRHLVDPLFFHYVVDDRFFAI